MAKRPQGLHKAALAKKKQKTDAPTKEVPEEVENVEDDEEIIQFGEEVDPNDEISSLYAIYKKYNAIQENLDDSDSKKSKEEDLKYINLMINTSDNILRLHEKKQEIASKAATTKKKSTTTEKSKEKEPIDFIPLQLPNKVYHIYTFALFTRGVLLLEEESFLIRVEREDKIGKERAIGFFELGLDMLGNSTDLEGLTDKTDGGDAFFLKSWGNVLLLQNKLVTKTKPTVRNYPTEVEPLIAKAKEMFTKGLNLIKKDEPITEVCWNAIYLLQHMGDTVYSMWTRAVPDMFDMDIVHIDGPNYYLHEEFLKRSTNLLNWTRKQYNTLETFAQTNDEKARALAGVAIFHLMRATPNIEEYQDRAQNFEATDDERFVRSLQKSGKKQLEDSIKMFEKAEKLYTEKAEKRRNRLLVTIAEAKLSLRDLLHEVDFLDGETKKERATLDRLQEKLKADAIIRLKKAVRLGLGDFSEVLEELEYEGSEDDDNDEEE